MKAIIAVALSNLTAAYAILGTEQPYRDLGPDFLEKRDRDKIARALTRRLTRLGYEVDIRLAA